MTNPSPQQHLLSILLEILKIADNEHTELDKSIHRSNISEDEKRNLQNSSETLKSTTEIARKLVEKLERYK
ncbi:MULTISPECIES: hypothetical protein [Bacillus]|uniref:Uncharacterized protein n=2 Tax=Bacillus cereus group TaxID=86661 RepID=A0A9W5KS07_BACCE|nr:MULTISPECIES: hypothetical protein [Bacillus cereus group]EKS8367518.1 hypothetical protein [Bacillus cereus]EEM44460.1 hypothetical protein bthur0005_57760 [Bacillus thuringiensis serovar pakistani str. T13001]EJR65639.1 hypothetical protein IK5_05367 [Bacillus cereus VD154]EKS8373774.1 hypothetical protein [Bacillus cereus]KIU76069.1 hypothetical protein C797_01974 [Bacillus thuringiensis Sbt003]